MKIILTLTKENFEETEIDMSIYDTESESFKYIELEGGKYAVDTNDLIKAMIALTARKEDNHD